MKKVSVIIPCYNQGEYVRDAIESVLNQTYKNVEIVCINDASTDNSFNVLQGIVKENPEIVFINEKENKGVVFARNKAIEISTGEYILPLDADDIIEPTYIEKAVAVLEQNPEIGAVYCKARFFGEKCGIWDLQSFSATDMLYSNHVFATALYRKKDFCCVGGYKEYMKNGYEDWDLWLSFLEIGVKFFQIDEVLFNYRKYKKKSRTDNCKNYMSEIYTNILKNHFSLYLKDKSFIEKIYRATGKKLKKYKMLFSISLVFNLVFLLLLFIKFILF